MSEVNGKLVNGIYIPYRVSDELKARFLAGNFIVLLWLDASFDKDRKTFKWEYWPYSFYHDENAMKLGGPFAFCDTNIKTQVFVSQQIRIIHGSKSLNITHGMTLNEFEKICESLKKN